MLALLGPGPVAFGCPVVVCPGSGLAGLVSPSDVEGVHADGDGPGVAFGGCCLVHVLVCQTMAAGLTLVRVGPAALCTLITGVAGGGWFVNCR